MVYDGGTVGGAGAALMVKELCKGQQSDRQETRHRRYPNSLWAGGQPRLVDQIREVIRLLRCGVLTGQGYVDGVGRFLRFHGWCT